MVNGGEHDLVTDLAPVTYAYSALVLEAASGIDEDPFPKCYVLAEICIDRREQHELLGHLFADQKAHESPQLLLVVISRIDLGGDLLSLRRISIQQLENGVVV